MIPKIEIEIPEIVVTREKLLDVVMSNIDYKFDIDRVVENKDRKSYNIEDKPYSVKELKEIAKNLGIKIKGNPLKKELISIIREHYFNK